ncbi:ribosomal protein S18-alanine N-acetyltransferase [Ornithinimicrobium cerasi]|uniref:ribosomal protein S18-alanine N-acetyltransferase n=1 Tax=Ornithinimicrobium cerasi TaxID=2248773 RepID=UPI000EFFAA4D|nr:ribosomal protein S18-alanine N-acetyltransferase [Ornithinimicrobium cerasi]
MRLRDAAWRDLAGMAELESRCFPVDPWSPATFWAELAGRPRRSYVVAVDDVGELAGYAGLDLSGDLADVMTIAVDPARRGSGLGARLLEELHTRAGAGGAAAVMLEVRADNGPARSLYAAHGYRVLRARPGYYRSANGTPSVDALVLRKELP